MYHRTALTNFKELKRHIRGEYTENWGEFSQTVWVFICKHTEKIAKTTAKVRLSNGRILKGNIYENYDRLPENCKKIIHKQPMFENYDTLV